MINKIFNLLTNKLEEYTVNFNHLHNKKYDILYKDTLNFKSKKVKIAKEESKNQEEINVFLLNNILCLIPQIIKQEKEIAKLQNYCKTENSIFLYNLLYFGLQEEYLNYSEMKSTIEMFYNTNRLNQIQYQTLIQRKYLEDKEYEE